MKKQILITFSLLMAANSFAEVCSKTRNYGETGPTDAQKCMTAGVGAGVATASGIYSVKKYSQKNSIEKQYTLRIFKSSDPSERINTVLRRIADGDKITVIHQLSESENRQYHINLMEENASSARSSAALHGSLALTATRSVSETINGQTYYRTEPDYAARTMHTMLAAQDLANAADYSAKANDARHGGPVPTYELEHVVDAKAGTERLAGSFVDEKISRGGRILSIDLLPAEKFAMAKSALRNARGGLVGVAAGAVFAAEEMISGAVANKLNDQSGVEIRDYKP